MSNVYIACPPLSEFEEAPKDQPNCQLTDCPKCKEKMWLSGKKRGVLMFAAVSNRDIYLACYKCFEQYAKDNPKIIRHTKMAKI